MFRVDLSPLILVRVRLKWMEVLDTGSAISCLDWPVLIFFTEINSFFTRFSDDQLEHLLQLITNPFFQKFVELEKQNASPSQVHSLISVISYRILQFCL